MQRELTALRKQFRTIKNATNITELERSAALDRLAARIQQLTIAQRDSKDGEYVSRREVSELMRVTGDNISSAISEWSYDHGHLTTEQIDGLIDAVAKGIANGQGNLQKKAGKQRLETRTES